VKNLVLRTLILALLLATIGPATVYADNGHKLFITSAVENPNDTVTLPLYRGTSKGNPVYYIILDTSSGELSDQLGVNRSQKLDNARNSAAVQTVTIINGVWDFPGTVDFTPVRTVVPGPTGFPPIAASPGAIGDGDYSPLVKLPNGTIVNAPQIANHTGQADKVVSLDLAAMKVTYKETHGFANGKAVRYVSTDASAPDAAALEDVTFAPKLNSAPRFNDDSTDSSLTSLAAFINGQTGANNPQRQGLNSALLDGLDPLNILRWTPNQGRYSPLWDVHPAQWSAQAINSSQHLRQDDWNDIENLVDDGLVTGPGGAPFASANFIVNCPIVSEE
jgi:hypothetical protein